VWALAEMVHERRLLDGVLTRWAAGTDFTPVPLGLPGGAHTVGRTVCGYLWYIYGHVLLCISGIYMM
jgi:hypothetical protein